MRCSSCKSELKRTTAMLFDSAICAWECTNCGEKIYDFSGDGRSCINCLGIESCIWR